MPVFRFTDFDCVLIHVPKTGGTSIRQGFFKGKYEGPVQGHVPSEWSELFKFAFVRNPFDRLVSAWRMFTAGMEQSREGQETGVCRLSLKDFLEIVTDESIAYDGPRRENLEVRIRHHTLPMTHPFYCVDQADFIGRFENLQHDFSVVCQRLGIRGELPHWNRSSRAAYQTYFDAKTRAIAEDYYGEDLDRFQYRFETPTAARAPKPSGGFDTGANAGSTTTTRTFLVSSASTSDSAPVTPSFDARSYYQQLDKFKIPCPVCQSTELETVAERDRYRMSMTTSGCLNCGMVFVNPQPSEDAMNEFYATTYRKLYESVDRPTAQYIQQGPFIPRARFVIKTLAPLLPVYDVRKALDIGCAEGTLLKLLKRRFPSLACYGLEPNAAFADYARTTSGAEQIWTSDFHKFFRETDESFDLITLTHVLEHFREPVSTLKEIRRLISPHGLLYVEVPNIMDPESRGLGQLHLAHLMYFHPAALKNTLQQAGFTILDFLTEGLPAKTRSLAAVCTPGRYRPVETCGPAEARKLFRDFQGRIEYRQPGNQAT